MRIKHYLFAVLFFVAAFATYVYAGPFDFLDPIRDKAGVFSKWAIGISGSLGGILALLKLRGALKRILKNLARLKSAILVFWDECYTEIMDTLRQKSPLFVRRIQGILYIVDDILEDAALFFDRIPTLNRYAKDLRNLLSKEIISRIGRALKVPDEEAMSKKEIRRLVDSNPAAKALSEALRERA